MLLVLFVELLNEGEREGQSIKQNELHTGWFNVHFKF